MKIFESSDKNNGENFVNAIVYALAHLLSHQDEVLVDKGAPPALKRALKLTRIVKLKGCPKPLALDIPIECDFCVFARSNPLNAIIVSAKTRLKEVFHVGTMWKLIFDMIGDAHCEKKWGSVHTEQLKKALYCFATADMIPPGGERTQGPDIERDDPRNLIKMDASFFDYVFVSKPNIGHVARTLDIGAGREALFHELGCIVNLVQQKFALEFPAKYV